jgi:hypothetical protein
MRTKTLLRASLPLNGFGDPMYLLMVRGRKSGQPHSIPVVIVEQEGEAVPALSFRGGELGAQSAGERDGHLHSYPHFRTHRHEEVHARELLRDAAGLVLKGLLTVGKNPPIFGDFDVTAQSSDQDFGRATASHPVFVHTSQG